MADYVWDARRRLYVDADGRKGHHVVSQFLWEKTDIAPAARAVLDTFTLEFEGHHITRLRRRFGPVMFRKTAVASSVAV